MSGKAERWLYRVIDQAVPHESGPIAMEAPATRAEVVAMLCAQYPDAPGFHVWPAEPRPGELAEGGTLRWCSACGLRRVARKHAELRCYACQLEAEA